MNKVLLNIALFSLVLLTAPTYSDTRRPLVDLKSAIEGLWIQPSQYTVHGEPRFIRFVVIPYEDSSYGSLKINFILPKNHASYTPTYILKRGDTEYIAETFVDREHDFYTVELSNLKKNERVEFSIGWQGASPAHYKVSALLITDKRSKSAHWISWLLR